MATVGDVLSALEALAPRRYAFGFDKVGLQVGDPEASVTHAVVSLDRSLHAVDHAILVGAEMLVSHHPLIFEPVSTVTPNHHVGRTILRLAENRIAFAAAHTNWDSALGGINDALASRLQLADVRPFGGAASVPMLKIVVTCPIGSVDALREAASAAGAGTIGNYSACSFESKGTGTFLGNPSSNPVVGERGRLERVEEARLEMVLREDQAGAVERAIRTHHPYEEPAFDFYRLTDCKEQAAGRIGHLASPLPLGEWAKQVEATLGTPTWAWSSGKDVVSTVAIVGGAADGEWRAALDAGADTFLTGEVRQHIAVEATEMGLNLVAAGHYATEHPGCEVLAERLRERLPAIQWECFSPPPGLGGRPL